VWGMRRLVWTQGRLRGVAKHGSTYSSTSSTHLCHLVHPQVDGLDAVAISRPEGAFAFGLSALRALRQELLAGQARGFLAQVGRRGRSRWLAGLLRAAPRAEH
jgi:hypothetical protein